MSFLIAHLENTQINLLYRLLYIEYKELLIQLLSFYQVIIFYSRFYLKLTTLSFIQSNGKKSIQKGSRNHKRHNNNFRDQPHSLRGRPKEKISKVQEQRRDVKETKTPRTGTGWRKGGKAKIASVHCGDLNSYAVTEEGEVYVWGLNNYNQLGVAMTTEPFLFMPHFSQQLSGRNITQIAAGKDHTAFLTEEGRVYTLGYGQDGRLGQGREVKHVDVDWSPTSATSSRSVPGVT